MTRYLFCATSIALVFWGCDTPVGNAPPPPTYESYGDGLGGGISDPSLDSLTPISDAVEQMNRDQQMIDQIMQQEQAAQQAAEPIQLEPAEPVQLQLEYAVPY